MLGFTAWKSTAEVAVLEGLLSNRRAYWRISKTDWVRSTLPLLAVRW